jgi:hypothetical protein
MAEHGTRELWFASERSRSVGQWNLRRIRLQSQRGIREHFRELTFSANATKEKTQMADETKVIVIGAVVVGGVVLLSLFRNSQRQAQIRAANEPGLVYGQSAYAADSGLASIIQAGSSSIASLFGSWGKSTGSNDPGLTGGQEPTDYVAGSEYDLDQTDPYSPDYAGINYSVSDQTTESEDEVFV